MYNMYITHRLTLLVVLCRVQNWAQSKFHELLPFCSCFVTSYFVLNRRNTAALSFPPPNSKRLHMQKKNTKTSFLKLCLVSYAYVHAKNYQNSRHTICQHTCSELKASASQNIPYVLLANCSVIHSRCIHSGSTPKATKRLIKWLLYHCIGSTLQGRNPLYKQVHMMIWSCIFRHTWPTFEIG